MGESAAPALSRGWEENERPQKGPRREALGASGAGGPPPGPGSQGSLAVTGPAASPGRTVGTAASQAHQPGLEPCLLPLWPAAKGLHLREPQFPHLRKRSRLYWSREHGRQFPAPIPNTGQGSSRCECPPQDWGPTWGGEAGLELLVPVSGNTCHKNPAATGIRSPGEDAEAQVARYLPRDLSLGRG